MSTRIYALPVEQTRWQVPDGSTTVFDWEYDEGRDRLLGLYEKGKQKQWDANERIDWSTEIDLDDPMGVPEETIAIYGTRVWERLGAKERGTVRHHLAAWQFSQFLHGEQGALICSSKIVHTVPDLDSKFYAATQVMDEARHVEVYSRYLREKLQLAYPINPGLKALLNDVIADSRWDMTYLGMQVLIEGLALAAFSLIRDHASEPLAKALNAYVMQDEARHVAFGRLALRDFYPELTETERNEREEFCAEACHLMQQRFLGEEVWRNLDVDADECISHMRSSEHYRMFQTYLFSRIVPTLKDIGLFGTRMRDTFAGMGIIGFEQQDIDTLATQDENIAEAFDRERVAQVERTIRLASGEA
ncbi:ferritin-like domain-containing protein [Streptomyces actinomycinicus]|uniref:Ferritin-like domain-containing protein n=1 Tax=Streptomyces actinomycinicus TaxID=1695166 RepID=A0A937EI37_9ACTN|nr:ferritin-like domain-containing protein [Streptomyces actinomycinicus]MBL1082680.1 ferritin-like domain-containing protein [Streptomyces actinomycinicus]